MPIRKIKKLFPNTESIVINKTKYKMVENLKYLGVTLDD